MTITVSLTVLTGILVAVLLRSGHQRLWPGIATALFGFSLASTGLGTGINTAIATVTGWLPLL